MNDNGTQQTFGIKEIILWENGVSVETWRKSQSDIKSEYGEGGIKFKAAEGNLSAWKTWKEKDVL